MVWKNAGKRKEKKNVLKRFSHSHTPDEFTKAATNTPTKRLYQKFATLNSF